MDVREKLAELRKEAAHYAICTCSAFQHCEDCPYRKYGTDCRDNIEMDCLIKKGVTVQDATDNNVGYKWISVKDRLPNKDGRYIVTACDEGCSGGDGIWYDTVVIEAEHYKGEWSWNENGTEYDITDFVTQWQPMPQPPKGE